MQYFVLRDRMALQTIATIVRNCRKCLFDQLTVPDSCLIPIHITMETRGHFQDFSIICLPKNVDFRRRLQRREVNDNEPVYTEPLKSQDDREKLRKKIRKDHLALLKRLRGRRVRVKRRMQEHAEKRVIIAKPGTAKIVADQSQRMRELWLAEVPNSARHQCSRETIGYLSASDFSFVEATVAGIGYVTLGGLRKFVEMNEKQKKSGGLVLVRGTTTRQYRFAKLAVRT